MKKPMNTLRMNKSRLPILLAGLLGCLPLASRAADADMKRLPAHAPINQLSLDTLLPVRHHAPTMSVSENPILPHPCSVCEGRRTKQQFLSLFSMASKGL